MSLETIFSLVLNIFTYYYYFIKSKVNLVLINFEIKVVQHIAIVEMSG